MARSPVGIVRLRWCHWTWWTSKCAVCKLHKKRVTIRSLRKICRNVWWRKDFVLSFIFTCNLSWLGVFQPVSRVTCQRKFWILRIKTSSSFFNPSLLIKICLSQYLVCLIASLLCCLHTGLWNKWCKWNKNIISCACIVKYVLQVWTFIAVDERYCTLKVW